jgi:hypothetical protein
MFFPISEGLQFSSEQKRVLQNLAIDENGPGTILHDFDALLGFVKESDKFTITPAHQLPLRAVSEINSRMRHPLQLGLKRPQQKSYPHVHGLYLLVRASGLTYVDGTGKTPVLMVDEEVYREWANLNPTERYGTLLEAWFLRGKPEIIGDRARPFGLIPENYHRATSFYVKIPSDGLPVTGHRDTEEWLLYRPGWYNLGLLELFGLVKIQHGAPEPGQGWRIERVYPTPVGGALLAALFSGFFGDIDNIFRLEDEGRVPVGILQSVLQPYVPAWKNNLPIPEWTFREGIYTFKVSLGPIWRRIAIGAKQPLDALASIILNSVEFDHDHLYQFSYQNRFGILQDIHHPYLEEPPFTSEVRIGDVPLRVGQTMIYLFDFGDQWEFDVTLEQVDPDRTIEKPSVLEAHGKPPEQYPIWDDWEA